MERCWAYLTIKDLLAKMEVEWDPTTVDSMKKKALELSLKVGD